MFIGKREAHRVQTVAVGPKKRGAWAHLQEERREEDESSDSSRNVCTRDREAAERTDGPEERGSSERPEGSTEEVAGKKKTTQHKDSCGRDGD